MPTTSRAMASTTAGSRSPPEPLAAGAEAGDRFRTHEDRAMESLFLLTAVAWIVLVTVVVAGEISLRRIDR